MKQERQRHLDAFEVYFKSRQVTLVAEEFKVSRKTVHEWIKAFNWRERIQVRDQSISKKVTEKVVISTINLKAKRLKEISQIQQILDATIKTAVEALQNKQLKALTANDLRALVSAKDMMMRTEQGLLGEGLEDKDVKIRISVDANN